MKIREVKQRYTEEGANAVEQDYRSIVSVFHENKIRKAIPNSDYLHMLYLNELMFNLSRRSVRMLCGDCKDGWMGVLRDSLDSLVTRIKVAQKGVFRVIILGDTVPMALVDLKKKHCGLVQYILAQATEKMRHFIVCDGRMVRWEDPHEPLTEEDDSACLTASVYLNNPIKASTMENYFDRLWGSINRDEE